MTTLREAAQQALEALESASGSINPERGFADEVETEINTTITALRAALAEPVQEPLAWMDREGDLYKMPEIEGWAPPHTMLYAAPPQRKPLTEEEIRRIKPVSPDLVDFRSGVRCAERAHGITE